MRTYLITVIILILVSASLIGCGGGSGSGGTGTVNLYLTDAPGDFKAVTVHITKVSISRSSDTDVPEDGWITLNTNPDYYDLLSLRFDERLLGAATLPAGTYHQLRLLIDDAKVTLNDDAGVNPEYELIIPSAETSGIKINLKSLKVSANQKVDLLMDVDVAKFIDDTSEGYKMRSTAIKVAKTSSVGKIIGKVTDSDGAAITDIDVVINVKQGADLITSTIALKEELNGATAGSFIINNLEPGDYTLVISADGYTPEELQATVQAGQKNDVGTNALSVIVD